MDADNGVFMDSDSLTWEGRSASYQEDYLRRKTERPGTEFEAKVAVILLAYDTAWLWIREIADLFGIPHHLCWRDPQFLGAFCRDDSDEMLNLAVDVRDPDEIRLTWTATLALGSEPQPLEDFATALEAARMYLTPAE